MDFKDSRGGRTDSDEIVGSASIDGQVGVESHLVYEFVEVERIRRDRTTGIRPARELTGGIEEFTGTIG